MIQQTSALIVLALATSAASLLAAPDLSKLPPASTKAGVTYDKDIRPLFEASCTRCHGAEKPKGGLRLDSAAAVLKGGNQAMRWLERVEQGLPIAGIVAASAAALAQRETELSAPVATDALTPLG